VLNARDGQQARPDGRTVALRVLMQQQGFTANEFAKLKEAEDSSNALVNTASGYSVPGTESRQDR